MQSGLCFFVIREDVLIGRFVEVPYILGLGAERISTYTVAARSTLVIFLMS